MKKVSNFHAQAADCRELALAMQGAERAAFLDMAVTMDCLALERMQRISAGRLRH